MVVNMRTQSCIECTIGNWILSDHTRAQCPGYIVRAGIVVRAPGVTEAVELLSRPALIHVPSPALLLLWHESNELIVAKVPTVRRVHFYATLIFSISP